MSHSCLTRLKLSVSLKFLSFSPFLSKVLVTCTPGDLVINKVEEIRREGGIHLPRLTDRNDSSWRLGDSGGRRCWWPNKCRTSTFPRIWWTLWCRPIRSSRGPPSRKPPRRAFVLSQTNCRENPHHISFEINLKMWRREKERIIVKKFNRII